MENVRAAVYLPSGINRSLFRRQERERDASLAQLYYSNVEQILVVDIASRPSKYPIDRSLSL